MKRGTLFTVFCTVGLLLSLPALAGAPPEAGQFFFGLGVGEAALNNDMYIYSSDAAARQPAIAPQESSQYGGPAYSAYAGRVIASKNVDFLGSSLLNVSLQGDYICLGKYTVNVEYADSLSGYRKVDEAALDLLLASTLYWEDGFNLFARGGIARLQGRYEQAGLRSPRQPGYIPPVERHTCVAYRPEIAVGLGYQISDHVNISVQYTSILGPQPDTSVDRFGEIYMIDLPNTVYKADSLTIGATCYW